MNLGVLEAAAAGYVETGMARPSTARSARPSPWTGRFSPRACLAIWLAGAAVSWGVIIGAGVGVATLARLVL
jgi:hypothetical protein